MKTLEINVYSTETRIKKFFELRTFQKIGMKKIYTGVGDDKDYGNTHRQIFEWWQENKQFIVLRRKSCIDQQNFERLAKVNWKMSSNSYKLSIKFATLPEFIFFRVLVVLEAGKSSSLLFAPLRGQLPEIKKYLSLLSATLLLVLDNEMTN